MDDSASAGEVARQSQASKADSWRPIAILPAGPGAGRERKVVAMPEWLEGLIQGGITVVALIVIVMLLAALFMIIFNIAAGIDDRIQE